jgi:CRP/FNR family transcriptional regulator, cyclic AMP receptor protein
MIPQTLETAIFKKRLAQSLQTEQLEMTTLKVAKHDYVYITGDFADSVYFVECGELKLLMLSTEGKECLVSLHTTGDTFGECCLAGSTARRESAMAMEYTILKRIACRTFLVHLTRHSLLEGFTQYLVHRIAEQQEMIANLLMVDSEHRLGETLLLLARKLGHPDPQSTRIEQKITHEELSEMVGTTRPRITHFLHKFRGMGLIQITREHSLIIHEQRLSAYLTRLN